MLKEVRIQIFVKAILKLDAGLFPSHLKLERASWHTYHNKIKSGKRHRKNILGK